MQIATPYEIIPDAALAALPGRVQHALALRAGTKEISAFLHRVDLPNMGVLPKTEADDKYYISVSLTTFSAANITCDGKERGPRHHRPGTTNIYDCRRVWQPEILQPHETFNLIIPHWKLQECRYECDSRRLDKSGANLTNDFDPVMHGLAQALMPALHNPMEASALFVEHVLSAATLHLAHGFGFQKSGALSRGGRLAPWQEKRAKDLLQHNLAKDISLAELALACGLSATYFARAFKNSTGVAPHRWLTGLRLERARALMLESSLQLAEIALLAGFADQSHFTRVFSKATGSSPGLWRRAHRF